MSVQQPASEARATFTDWMRARFKGILDPVAGFLNRLGLMPNTVTLIGLGGNLIGAYFLARGFFLVGGLLVLVMGIVDALDGTMARLRGERSDFGAFVDSVTDRYSELLIFGGMLVYYLLHDNLWMAVLTFAAAAGSVLVSYVRSRAESLGFQARVGLLTRMERYLVLAPSLVLGFPWFGIAVIAVLGNATALQRILAVRRQARQK
jgi:CDP-diacylglycerol---glycerol-3-phosphate 3-phosphatidyltransferase